MQLHIFKSLYAWVNWFFHNLDWPLTKAEKKQILLKLLSMS